jgi:RNA polymerase sigma factor (sigma-70 family)
VSLSPKKFASNDDKGLHLWTLGDFGAFYSRHRRELLSHATRLLKDSLKAEEVVQESLMKVMLAAPELTSEEHATAYVHKVVENLAIDLYRLEGRRPNLVLLDEETLASERIPYQDLSDAISAAEDAAIVRQALSMLSPAERAALVMWEMEGRSSKEIARELGIKESSVRHTVSRARASLRKVMSQLVIDDARGLTALDLLSNTYKKAAGLAKNSSKVALSIALVIFAFVGFNSFNGTSQVSNLTETAIESQMELNGVSIEPQLQDQSTLAASQEVDETSEPVPSKKSSNNSESKNKILSIPGTDKSGIPSGFFVSDSTGSVGEAYFREKSMVVGDTDVTAGQIIKTTKGAANVFLSQRIRIDSAGLVYEPTLSFGQSGMWVPLEVRVDSLEIKRNSNGNYLVTAFIAVESAIETPIKIVAKTDGRDLIEAPRQVVTRLVLDSSKTQVLSQVVYVVEKGIEA